MKMTDYDECYCGSTDYDLSPTIVVCKKCGRVWGRQNGVWTYVPSSAPKGEVMNPMMRVILLPKDTNMHGSIFGGVILSHIDLAASAEVRRHTIHPHVTVAMDAVKFKKPVYVGDLVTFYTTLVKKGTTSITVRVTVDAERYEKPHDGVSVTEAEVTFVTINLDGEPIPHDAPEDASRTEKC